MYRYANPLSSLATALRTGARDVASNLAYALYQLNMVDSHVHAFLPESGRRERVFHEAEMLRQHYPDPEDRPALYGVPVAVKDIYAVTGLPTRAGSSLPPELFAGPEAACVTHLGQAGAIVLGKTVTTEFAFFEPGPTRNPLNLAHTPGGSSSGSAAAVAAGLVPLALGTQTIGSTIRPAAYCGIVGFKPSYGRVDPSGVLFVAPSLDHVGLFTQDVQGMALAAAVLCRDWKRPSKSNPVPVLGVPDGRYLEQASPEALRAFEAQVQELEAAGYKIERIELLEDIAEINHLHRELMAYEMAQVHENWFKQYERLYRPRTADLIRQGQRVTEVSAAAGKQCQHDLREALERVMRETGIDVWISPAAPGPAPEGLASTGDPLLNLPWTHAGLPTLTVPAGQASNGLPLGLQCASVFGSDEQLLLWGETLHSALQPDVWND